MSSLPLNTFHRRNYLDVQENKGKFGEVYNTNVHIKRMLRFLLNGTGGTMP